MLAFIGSAESQVFECWVLLTEAIHHNSSYEKNTGKACTARLHKFSLSYSVFIIDYFCPFSF